MIVINIIYGVSMTPRRKRRLKLLLFTSSHLIFPPNFNDSRKEEKTGYRKNLKG